MQKNFSADPPPISNSLLEDSPILLTRPLLPDLARYTERLSSIWESTWLTNNGQMVQALESALCAHLMVPHLSLLSNGTTALMVAMAALGLKGEIITTPFTFPATVHALSCSCLKLVGPHAGVL